MSKSKDIALDPPLGQVPWGEHFLALARGSSTGLVVFALPPPGRPEDLVLEYSSPAASALDSRDLTEHWGTRAFELFPGLAESELPAMYRDVALGADPIHIPEYRYTPRHEDSPFFELDIFPLPGRRVGVQYRNISPRVEALQAASRAHAIVQSSHDAILGKTLEGIITDWNPAAERLYGYTASEMVGRSIERLVPEERRDELAGIMESVRRGEAVEELETERLHKDGRRIEVSLRISPILDAAGEPIGASAVARDISERRLLEQYRLRSEQLREESVRIREAQRVKSEFVANMSHDLRTPLNAITGFTKLLLRPATGLLDDRQRSYLGHVLEASEDLLGLIDDILDLARVESGKLEFIPEEVDAQELLDQVVALVRERAAKVGCRVHARVDPALEPLYLDPRRLKQVLFNFLSNAVKFSPEGGQIEVRVTASGEGAFRVAVEDEGIGIEADDLPRLFDEFHQLDSGANRHYPGHGLGLAIVRKLVEAQGGEVGVRSQKGVGSEFWALLPTRFGVRSEAHERSEAVASSWISEVLVVEDDPDQRSWVIETLEAAGYRVRGVGTGREAIQLTSARRFAAILLDLLLPDVDGWDVARALRASGPNYDTPVLVVSVAPKTRVAEAVRVDEFLPKPVDPEELELALRRHGVRCDRRPILVVDADQEERHRVARELERSGCRVVGAASADEACELFRENAPEAVVVALTTGEVGAPELLARLRSLDGDGHCPVVVHAPHEVGEEERRSLLRWAQDVVTWSSSESTGLVEVLRLHLRTRVSGPAAVPQQPQEVPCPESS